MAYNKAKAEREWAKWKEAEEKKLRELGVDEDTIQRLHAYDWAEFNRERRYLQRWSEWPFQIEAKTAVPDVEIPVESVETLLNSVENERLFQILCQEDQTTLKAILMKMMGYSTEQICHRLGITVYAYYNRIKRLKENLRNFLERD